MLQVKTYIDKSPINGIGLFSETFIPKGTVVWDFTEHIDLMYSKHVVDNMKDNPIKQFLKRYSYLDGDMGMPQYVLCVDDARFMNHSDHPNTTNGQGHKTIASRDILTGEEITCDYYEIDDDAKSKF